MIDLQERFLERKSFIYRLFLVYLMFGLLLIIILYQTFQLQIANYSEYEIAALENKTHEMNIQATRGLIYDRDGNILVKNIPTFNLISIPNKINDPKLFIESIKGFIDLNEDEENIFFEKFKSNGVHNCKIEGKDSNDWKLVDGIDLIVHIFNPEKRKFYELEKMWSELIPKEKLII